MTFNTGQMSQTITFTADYSGEVDLPPRRASDPPSVTFNTGQMSQTITFEAIQDDVDDDGESALLGFGTLAPSGLTWDDHAGHGEHHRRRWRRGLSVSESSLTIAEGTGQPGSGTYTIVLDSQPTDRGAGDGGRHHQRRHPTRP